jgi:cytochrome P450
MTTAPAQLPPGPKENLLFSKEVDLRNGILDYVHKSVRQYNGISRAKLGPYHYVNISSPAYIEHVFLHRDIYIKGRDNKNLKFLLGNGLLTNEGEFWLKQRRLMQPLFHKQRLQGFVQKIKECTNQLMNSWQPAEGKVTDMHREMVNITLEIVGKTLLSTEVRGDFQKVSDALVIIMEGMIGRTRSFIRLPYWMPTIKNMNMRRNRALLNDTIFNIINERRKSKTKYDDLLTKQNKV